MTTTPTSESRARYACPDWCERWDHHADVVDADNPPRHFGPDFGIFDAQADGDDEPQVVVHEPITFKGRECAAGLRKVAADALAAAEWLESVR